MNDPDREAAAERAAQRRHWIVRKYRFGEEPADDLSDFIDLLRSLLDHDVEFLVVGAHAMAIHGVPRATGDLDVWVDSNPVNTERAWQALLAFGAPVRDLGIDESTLEAGDTVLQIGQPPRRIDILTRLSGLRFADAWFHRVRHSVRDLAVPFISRADLVRNKRAMGRTKDLADVELLQDKLL